MGWRVVETEEGLKFDSNVQWLLLGGLWRTYNFIIPTLMASGLFMVDASFYLPLSYSLLQVLTILGQELTCVTAQGNHFHVPWQLLRSFTLVLHYVIPVMIPYNPMKIPFP